jgi:hypothetical protein
VWTAASALLAIWPFPEDPEWTLIHVTAFGFVAGAWMHLLMDIPNPTGIPILSPRARSRFGFGWWKSGNALEPLAGVFMAGLAGLLLFWVAHWNPEPVLRFLPASLSMLFHNA